MFRSKQLGHLSGWQRKKQFFAAAATAGVGAAAVHAGSRRRRIGARGILFRGRRPAVQGGRIPKGQLGFSAQLINDEGNPEDSKGRRAVVISPHQIGTRSIRAATTTHHDGRWGYAQNTLNKNTKRNADRSGAPLALPQPSSDRDS